MSTVASSYPVLKRISTPALPAQSMTRPISGLFSGLSKDEIDQIMRAGIVRRLEKSRIISRCDEPAMHLFLIERGSVNYSRTTPDGREVLLRRLSRGEAFGIATLLEEPIKYIGTSETAEETELYAWEHKWMCRYAVEHPKLVSNALRIALEYIRLYSVRHLALVSDSAEHRVSRALMRLGVRIGKPHPKGIEVPVTNLDLASLADVGYFTTTKVLSHWQRKGAMEKSRGKVIIVCPEKMHW